MSFKKIIILICVACGCFYFINEEKTFFSEVFDKINLEDLTASLNKVEEEKSIRIYNSYPSGETLTLKEDTKLLSKADGAVYQLKETITIPGASNGEPGKVDAQVIIIEKGDAKVNEESVITIPGLNSTNYFETTWAKVILEEEVIEVPIEEEKKTSTLVNGIIKRDTFWELKNSPYIIDGNIFIGENATLFIEAGVEVIFNEGCGFIIEGEIRMVGQKISPIKVR